MDTRIPVKLGDVSNPNEFMFVRITPQNEYHEHKQEVLKNFSLQVKENLEILLLSAADHSLEVGNLFYVLYNHEWTRAKIVKIIEDEGQIAFFLIDLGKTHILELEDVYHQVAVLPENKFNAKVQSAIIRPMAFRFQLFGKFCIHTMH